MPGERIVKCLTCSGTGVKTNGRPGKETLAPCPSCGGTGKVAIKS